MNTGRRSRFRRVEYVMGTVITLSIADPLEDAEYARLSDEVFGWLREVDARFSTYRDDSEVNRLDRGELTAAGCSPDLRHVLDACADLWRETDGYFDTYATGRLDPSGYVKGWSVRVASERLAAAGAANHYLNAGGDISVRGSAVDGGPWRIGILHPHQTDKLAWVLGARDTAIATSGTYERGVHVINPYTGKGARELRSVTVVGPDLALADAYATAALAMGMSGIDWLAALPGYECAIITEDGRRFGSPGLPVTATV